MTLIQETDKKAKKEKTKSSKEKAVDNPMQLRQKVI